MSIRHHLFTAVFSVCFFPAAFATQTASLSTVYQQAIANDTELAAIQATQQAEDYGRQAARGALLPKANLSYSISQVKNKNSTATFPNAPTEKSFTQKNLQVQASQTLFDLNSWYNYKAASSSNDASSVKLQQAEQNLLLRTAQIYFDILRAQDNLSVAQAEQQSLQRSLEQTQQRYDAGLVTIVDVHDTQARYDLAQVNLLGQQSNLDISLESLEQLTGKRHDSIAPLSDDADMGPPQPADVEEWITLGMANYAGLRIAEANKESARLKRNANRAKHAPKLDLFAQYSKSDQPLFTSDGTYSTTSTVVGLKLSVPLLAGGSLYSQSKQAARQYAAAEYQLEGERRSTKHNIRSLFRKVKTDVLNIKARNRVITSAQSALEATQTGYKLGTRNIVEVLDAQRTLFKAQRNYANARYDYIQNLLNLKFYAGTLNPQDMDVLNSWLKK